MSGADLLSIADLRIECLGLGCCHGVNPLEAWLPSSVCDNCRGVKGEGSGATTEFELVEDVFVEAVEEAVEEASS